MSEINDQTPTSDLIDRFVRNILYDCHSVERRVNFSDARKELQRRGRVVLKEIAEYLTKTFSGKGFREFQGLDEDLFLAWGYLLFGIARDHNLQNPYPNVVFGDQNMGTWTQFCLSNAEN